MKGKKQMTANNLLFSSKAADDINKAVKQISDRHFIFLNYCPERMKVFGEDGKFLMGINNLNIIFKEAGWLINDFGYIYTGETGYSSPVLRNFNNVLGSKIINDINKTISDLRTLSDHNISNESGDTQQIQRCENWFVSNVGVKSPDSEEDYRKLVAKLESYAIEIEKYCYAFLDEVKKCDEKNRAEMLERWTERTINRYIRSKDTFLNLFTQQVLFSPSSKYRCRNHSEERKIAYDLIISSYIKPYSKFADQINIISKKSALSKATVTMLNDSLEKYSNKLLCDFNNKYGELKFSTMSELYGLSSKQRNLVIDYFFETELNMLIVDALENDSECTLNPADLVESIIKNSKVQLELDNGKKISQKRFDLQLSI